MPNKWVVLINGGISLIDQELNKRRHLNKRQRAAKAKAFIYGYKTSCYNCMAKYASYFIYRDIPPEVDVN